MSRLLLRCLGQSRQLYQRHWSRSWMCAKHANTIRSITPLSQSIGGAVIVECRALSHATASSSTATTAPTIPIITSTTTAINDLKVSMSTAAANDSSAPSTAEPTKKLPLRQRVRAYLATNKRFFTNTAVLALATGASYLVFTQTVDFVAFLSSVHHVYSMEYAYVAGGVTVIATGLIFTAAKSLMPLSLPSLYRTVLKRLKSDDSVRAALGDSLTFGRGVRVVNVLPSGVRWRAEPNIDYHGSWERYYQPRRAQFVVAVNGERGTGVVVAQIDHKLNDYKIIHWLTVEHVHSHSGGSSDSSRIVVTHDGGAWHRDVTSTAIRVDAK